MSTEQPRPQTLRQDAAKSVFHPLTRALLILTFTTGVVDAVSYLGLGKVFTANMTGNVVLLGFGIAGAAKLPVLSPLISLGAFLVGAGLGGALAVRLAGAHSRHITFALAIEAGLIAIAAILAAAIDIHPSTVTGDVVIALLAFAMGVRNATIRRVAVPDLTTTVLTMTLTGLAADSVLAGGSGEGSTRRAAAVLAMLLGALVGALALKTSLLLALTIALALVLLTWLLYIPGLGRDRPR